MQAFEQLPLTYFLRHFMLSHTEREIINKSNELDQRADATMPPPGLHDEKFVIEDMREQLKKHEALSGAMMKRLDKQEKQIEEQEKQIALFPTEREIEVLVDVAMRKRLFDVQRDFNIKLADNNDQWAIETRLLRYRIEELEQTTPSSNSKPLTQLNKPLPASDQITRMTIELYENFHDPKAPKTRAKVQLKVNVNGIKGYWLMPLHRPDDHRGRFRLKPIMPQIDELGRESIKYAGCQSQDGDSRQAYVTTENQLQLVVAGQAFAFSQPKLKSPDEHPNAPAMRWYFPD